LFSPDGSAQAQWENNVNKYATGRRQNRTKAARILGISRAQLYRLMKQLEEK
jgi:DNA-binding NtrC family response regulator